VRRFRLAGALGALVGWLVAVALLGSPNHNAADYLFFDTFANRVRPRASDEIVLIGIDEKTVIEWKEPSVFWSSRVARIVRACLDARAAFVAVDFVPAASVDAYLDERGDTGNRPNTELGVLLAENHERVALGFRGGENALFPSQELILSPEVESSLFSIELPYSTDGRVRTFLFEGAKENRLAPSIVRKIDRVRFDAKREVWLLAPKENYLIIPAHELPERDDLQTLVKGKVVLVGATAPSLGDMHPVASREVIPGVSVHASLIQNLIEKPVYSALGWFLPVIIGIISAGLASIRAKWGLLIGLAVPVVGVALGVASLASFSVIVSAGSASLAGLVATLSGWAARAAVEAHERHKIETVFGVHVSKNVLQYIFERGIDSIDQSPETTVMFLDVRASTKMGERLSSNELFTELNQLFETIARPIEENGGVINRFLGDGFLAIFGAPVPKGDHAQSAFRSATAILSRLENFNTNRERAGLPAIRIGIGLHTGALSQGFLGSTDRREYTVIGDTVNAASRIQDLTKSFNSDLVLSEATHGLIETDKHAFERFDAVELKGKSEKVNVYVFRN